MAPEALIEVAGPGDTDIPDQHIPAVSERVDYEWPGAPVLLPRGAECGAKRDECSCWHSSTRADGSLGDTLCSRAGVQRTGRSKRAGRNGAA